MRIRIGIALGACALFVGCSSDTASLGGGDGGTSGTVDAGGQYTDAGGQYTDAGERIICVGDPDTQVICRKESEFWDCAETADGKTKCAYNGPEEPAGSSTWTCGVVEGKLVCTTDTPNVEGGGDWSCTTDDDVGTTTCEKPLPVTPGGSGTYECTYDAEFGLVCTTDEPPPVTPPVEPPVTGSGQAICYDADPNVTGLPTPPEGYWAKLISERVLYNGVEAVHIKLTFSKAFVDNTYGDYAIGYHSPTSIGGGHSFNDLVGSDKAEFFVDDHKGNLVFWMVVDYISASNDVTSGYTTLGVSGGDGQVKMGEESDVLAAQTSLAVNFNSYGYVLTDNSPVTDLNYTPDPNYPDWIFEFWYEVWVKWSAFGPTGPGRVYITGLHASPNKTDQKTLPIVQGVCP